MRGKEGFVTYVGNREVRGTDPETVVGIEVDGRALEVSNPGKAYFPGTGQYRGATKHDVVAYYARVSQWMLPQVRGRPLTMQRFPDGAFGQGFIQKEVPGHFPDWVVTSRAENVAGGGTTYVLCEDAPTLVYLATQAVLTPHVWLSRADDLDRPDQLVFDLDPPGDGDDAEVDAVQHCARLLRDLLTSIGLPSYVKSSGSKGLHLHVPLDRSAGFGEARSLAQSVAARVVSEAPDTLTVEARRDKRHGRVFIDTGRNAYGQHAVAPYALRAYPEGPVAVPLDWDEALASDFHPRRWTLENIFRRLTRKKDPWAGMSANGASATAARRLLDALG